MRVRPRDPEPVAGQPKPRQARVIRPHWIDRTNYLIALAMLGGVIAAAGQGH